MTKAFTIRDIKSDSWMVPFFQTTRATAMREMSFKLKNDSMLKSYSADFQLHETGTFDEQTGLIVGLDQPVYICDISDLEVDTKEPPNG